jgi:hypothetical protein
VRDAAEAMMPRTMAAITTSATTAAMILPLVT